MFATDLRSLVRTDCFSDISFEACIFQAAADASNRRASYYTIGLGATSRNYTVVRNVLTGGGIDNDGSGNVVSPNP